jgi:hypothetical protein
LSAASSASVEASEISLQALTIGSSQRAERPLADSVGGCPFASPLSAEDEVSV